MSNLNHQSKGSGNPPIVFVHGFACALSDWREQVAHFSATHRTVAVDLRGHGKSPGTLADATIERLAEGVADLMETLDLAPAVIVGHSMGCRVSVAAARRVPARTAGLVLVDGSRFGAPGISVSANLAKQFANLDSFRPTVGGMFKQMFLADSDPALVSSIVDRANALPKAFGTKLLVDLARWDEQDGDTVFAGIRVPLLAIQSTFTDPERRRSPLRQGQSTPYLDFIRAKVPGARIEVIPDVGHFPQLERADVVNAAMQGFLAGLGGARSGQPAT